MYLASAELHSKAGNMKEMKNSLQLIHSVEVRVEFLKKRNLVDDAARELLKEGRGVEAAKIMKENGSFLVAAEYARSSGDSILEADCILAYVRSSMGISKEEQIERLEEAKKLYKIAGRLNSFGEVLLQQARLSGDRRKVEEALRFFRTFQNTCGELDCVELLWELEGDEHGVPGLDTWIAVKMVESVLQLIESLNGSNQDVMTQTQIERCEEHFGLYREGDPSKRVVRRKECDRFLSVAQGIQKRPVPGNKWEVDLYDARDRIAEVLFHRLVKLIQQIRRFLHNTFVTHETCQQFLVGLPCIAESCQYQHKLPCQDSYDQRFGAILNEIWLDAQANDFRKKAKKFGNDNALILQRQLGGFDDLFPLDTFASCRKLLAFFFPANGQSSSIRVQSYICRLRGEKREFFRRLFKFAEELWSKRATREEILSSADSFLAVSHLLQLIGSATKIKPWITDAVETFRRQNCCIHTKKLVIPKSVGIAVEKGTQLTLFSQWWEDSKIYLHFDGDILKAGHNAVRRFLTMAANPGKQLPFPSPRNCLDILEYFTCAHLALFARLQQSLRSRYHVCLPASYSSVISFWSTLNCTNKEHIGIYQAALRHPTHPSTIREVQKFLYDLVKLMLGGYSPNFNVLKKVFHLNSSIESGEAERAVILVLTLLCNCGQSVPPDCEARLLQNLNSEFSSDVILSERIERCLKYIRQAKGIRDIVIILRDLLETRHEILSDVHWENFHQRLWWDKVNPNNYPETFYTDVLEKVAQKTKDLPAEEVLESGDVEDSLTAEFGAQLEDDRPSEDMDHTRNERLEAIEREEALQAESWEEEITAEKARAHEFPSEQEVIEDPVDIYFRPFRVDQSGCGICNVSFGPDQSENYQHSLKNENSQLENNDAGASGFLEQSNEPSPYRFWSRARHLAKDSPHSKKVEHFEAYKKLFREELFPYQCSLKNLLNEAADLLRTAEYQGRFLTLLSTKMDEVNRAHYFITEVTARIQQERNWKDLETFKKAIMSLREAMETCEEEIQLIGFRESG